MSMSAHCPCAFVSAVMTVYSMTFITDSVVDLINRQKLQLLGQWDTVGKVVQHIPFDRIYRFFAAFCICESLYLLFRCNGSDARLTASYLLLLLPLLMLILAWLLLSVLSFMTGMKVRIPRLSGSGMIKTDVNAVMTDDEISQAIDTTKVEVVMTRDADFWRRLGVEVPGCTEEK